MSNRTVIRGLQHPVKTDIIVPTDKSISHRSIILSALAEGDTRITGFLEAEDTLNTLNIFRECGIRIEKEKDILTVYGQGLYGLKAPDKILDVGNSGTALRLLLGVFAGQSFSVILTGDKSIQSRPMDRVIKPLNQMGARFYLKESEGHWVSSNKKQTMTPPVRVHGRPYLRGIQYKMPMSSAQVKSCLLLATCYANSPTTVIDPGVSRDHTEIMMRKFGVDIEQQGHSTVMKPVQKLKSPGTLHVPGDISSAAFWIVLGTIIKDSVITIKNVGLNPTRTGLIDALRKMGANIVTKITTQSGSGEVTGDITIRYTPLRGTTIDGELMPRLIDEIPILCVAAAYATGETTIRDAGELRVKESDRIKTTAKFLRSFGVEVDELEDGMIIKGGRAKKPGKCESYKDHRIAMSAMIMGLSIPGEHCIMGTDCIGTSYPSFMDTIKELSRDD